MDDLRSLNAQLKTALNERIPSLEVLCDLLLPPLQFLQLGEGTLERNSWTQLPDELRLIFIERYLPGIQVILIQTVYLDWHQQLRDKGCFGELFEQWFCPSGNCQAPLEHQALVALAAYKSILSVLAPTANPLETKPANLHASTFSNSCALLSSLSTDYSIDALYSRLLNESKDGPKKRSTWTDIIQSLFAVPAKVANAHNRVKQCIIPDTLQWPKYMSSLALSCEILLSTPSISIVPAQAAEVPSKFARVGFLKTYHLSGSSRTSFWHVVLPRLWPQIQSSERSMKWQQAMQELPKSDLISFASSLCSYISSSDSVMQFDIEPFSQTKEASQRVKTVANLLRKLFGPVQQGREGDMARLIIRSCFLQKEGWQIGWSRVLVCWSASSEPDISTTEGLEWLLEETVSNWVNSNVIEHSPIPYHTYLTATLLLCASSLPQAHPAVVSLSSKSIFLNAVQSHLSCLRIPVRLMGMLAAEIISQRSFAPGSTVAPLGFGSEIWHGDGQAQRECAALRKLLTDCSDMNVEELKISTQSQAENGRSDSSQTSLNESRAAPIPEKAKPEATKKKESEAKSAQANRKIQIIDSSTLSSDSEDDLVPYSMPDATAEESDSDLDDPSAYTSNKKKAPPPVYIPDLTAYLRATDDAEKLGMALQEAAGLIRKKTGWGLELEEHAVDLAFALLGLQDNFDLAEFDQRKQNALVALLVGCPDKAAPALIEQFFLHQYSVAQRMAVLAALALSSRELAGLSSPSPSNRIQTNNFPSKTLPDKLHKQLIQDQEAAADKVTGSLSVASIDAINASLGQTSISDTRSATTDRLPAASREKLLSVGKITRANTSKAQAIASAPRFAAVASECFLMPLINRMWLYLRDVSHQTFTAGSDGIILSSVTLSRFYSCLTVMLDASRHSAHFLAVLVPECMELCLGMRGVSSEEQVLAGQLQTMLTALNTSVALDAGRTLRVNFRELVWKVKDFAESIWQGPQVQKEAGSTRFAAGVLLRADEVLGV